MLRKLDKMLHKFDKMIGLNLILPAVIIESIFAIVVIAAIWALTRRFWRVRGGKLPPGPHGLPIVGVLPFLGKHVQETFTEWAKKYGSIYSMYMGPRLVVVLNDYEIIKEAYVDNAEIWTGRPPFVVFKHMARNRKLGVISAEGDNWRQQRAILKKAHMSLAQPGGRMEQHVLAETPILIDNLLHAGSSRGAFDPDELINKACGHIGFALLYNKRFENDSEASSLAKGMHELAKIIGQDGGVFETFPFLRYVPPFRAKWLEFVGLDEKLYQFTRTQVQRVKSEMEDDVDGSKREPQCDVEWMLQERYEKYGTDNEAAEQDSVHCLANIYVNAGVLLGPMNIPTTATISWVILLLAQNPDIQNQCYQEIADNVGTERPVKLSDRLQLPYCEAVIYETMRCVNVTPSAVPHATTRDTHLRGYFIPERTMVIKNLWAAHWDERQWPNPKEFKPERFLTNSGGKRAFDDSKIDSALLFLIGPRLCPGIPITRLCLFLIITNLMQRVEFLAPGDGVNALPSKDEYVDGIEIHPVPYKISTRSRSKQ